MCARNPIATPAPKRRREEPTRAREEPHADERVREAAVPEHDQQPQRQPREPADHAQRPYAPFDPPRAVDPAARAVGVGQQRPEPRAAEKQRRVSGRGVERGGSDERPGRRRRSGGWSRAGGRRYAGRRSADSRTTSVGPTRSRGRTPLRCSISSSTSATARRPSSRKSQRTDVSGGLMNADSGRSSKPTRLSRRAPAGPPRAGGAAGRGPSGRCPRRSR